ncbi:MAG: 1-acyl-sn-glycerol-3-phosphate acyltransferase [Actinobacteria bacterium]|nr:1-acyl-sn-glycerol-3-phosphate acyltransferase [Actinomycetota bacterium]
MSGDDRRSPLEALQRVGPLARVGVAKARRSVRRLEFPLRAPSVPASVEPVVEESTLGARYETDWARTFPARVGRALLLETVLRPTVRVLADPDRRGYDRIAGLRAPAIFAANHHSHVDAGLLLSSLPEPFRHKVFTGAAADYFFDKRAKAVLSALTLGAIPIERSKVTRRSADQAATLIDDGWSMVIFPEGGRSPDGWGQAFRGGAAYLSIRCHVPVVPVHIEGTGRILPKGSNRITPGRTRVTFGHPLHPTGGEDSRRFAARLEREVAALADEVANDWWSARRRAHAGESPSLSGPDASAWRRAWALGDRRNRTTGTAPERRRWPD